MKKSLIILFMLLSGLTITAQEIRVRDERGKEVKQLKDTKDQGVPIHHMFDLSAGFGMQYAGIGFKFGVSPITRLNLFVAGGIYLADFGWQAGAAFYILKKTTKNFARPNVKAMYGTNAAILIIDENGNIHPDYSKVYKGPTFGAGVELRFGKSKKHGLDIDLDFPIRSQEYKDAIETIKNDPAIDDFQEPGSVAFSIGYHFEF